MVSPPTWGHELSLAIPAPWRAVIGEETVRRVADIGAELGQGFAGEAIIPEPDRVFHALSLPPEKVTVIIIGQDPYPTPGHATGRAFSIPRGVWPPPPTLRNILRELADDTGVSLPRHGNLHSWHRQGVLLLNRHLTTIAHQPGAHRRLGWAEVTDRIVAALAETNPRRVAVLWGREAEQLRAHTGDMPVVASAHPSPLSAAQGFFGSRPFSRVNEYRVAWGEDPIDWRLDPDPDCQPG